MKNIHIELLKEFENTGLSSKKSISKFMETNFKKPTSDDREEWVRQDSTAHLFLNDIQKIGHLDIDNTERSGIRYDGRRWYDNVDINARITVDGISYLDNYRTNRRITKNSNLQTIAIFLTVLFTLGALVVSGLNYLSENSKSTLEKQAQEQSLQIHRLQIELSQATNELIAEKEAKKILPKKP